MPRSADWTCLRELSSLPKTDRPCRGVSIICVHHHRFVVVVREGIIPPSPRLR
ncbi:MAG: hypothetical protein V1789_02615 [PVC group bacterium]